MSNERYREIKRHIEKNRTRRKHIEQLGAFVKKLLIVLTIIAVLDFALALVSVIGILITH